MDRKVVVKNFEGSAEDLRALFTANGLVAELEDDWTPVNRAMHEQYDFVNFICKAKEYSEKEPPDVVQFSEKVWGAAALCVKQFYLNNFRILIKSHQARSVMVDLIGAGCNWKDAVFLGKTWKEAEMSHSNIYNMEFVTKPSRDSLLQSIERMYEITNTKCDISLVGEELKKLDSVTIKPSQGVFKIVNDSFPYTHVAF